MNRKPTTAAHQRRARIVLTVYLVILLTLTHWPNPGPIPEIPGGDKTLHFGAYFIAAMLVAGCYSSIVNAAYVLSIVGLVMLGAVDEWTQSFVRRSPSFYDFLADTGGIVVAMLVTLGTRHIHKTRRKTDLDNNMPGDSDVFC